MNEKKLKNFLTNGFQGIKDDPEEEVAEEETFSEEEVPVSEERTDVTNEVFEERMDELSDNMMALRSQVEELRAGIAELKEDPPYPDMSPFVTTREQIKSLTTAIDRQNVEITNKALVSAMEQIATMREDFFKLCQGMRAKIDTMSAKDVLSSFEAYEVDMENILSDGGVFIGHFPYDSLNTIHQRIVDVVPTDDPEKNSMIAERLSDGYKLGNRVLLKEKVSVYKYIEPEVQEPAEEEAKAETEEETVCETISETVSDKPEESEKKNEETLEEEE